MSGEGGAIVFACVFGGILLGTLLFVDPSAKKKDKPCDKKCKTSKYVGLGLAVLCAVCGLSCLVSAIRSARSAGGGVPQPATRPVVMRRPVIRR